MPPVLAGGVSRGLLHRREKKTLGNVSLAKAAVAQCNREAAAGGMAPVAVHSHARAGLRAEQRRSDTCQTHLTTASLCGPIRPEEGCSAGVGSFALSAQRERRIRQIHEKAPEKGVIELDTRVPSFSILLGRRSPMFLEPSFSIFLGRRFPMFLGTLSFLARW